MAKELGVIPKQFQTQPVDLGESNAFARLQQSLNAFSEFASGKATDLYVEEAKKAGIKKAFDFQGDPQKSAPGLTKATRAENEAYLSATAKLLSVQMNRLVTENTQYVNENLEKLGNGALDKLNSLNDASFAGFESQVPEEIKNDLRYEFILAKEKTIDFTVNNVSKFNIEKTKQSFSETFSSDLTKISESIFAGDEPSAKDAYRSALKTISDYKELGSITRADELAYKSKIEFAVSDSMAVSKYLRAKATSPAAEQAYLVDAANNMPTGINREQWISGQNAILKEMKRVNKLTESQISFVKAQIDLGIADGNISTQGDLEAYANSITGTDFLEYSTKLANKNKSENKMQENVDQYNLLVTSNPSEAVLMSDDVKDEAFRQQLEEPTQKKRDETGDPNAKLTLREMAVYARQAPGKIRLFSTKLQMGMKSSNPEEQVDAFLAYKDSNGDPGQVARAKVLDVDAETDRIAFNAMTLIDNSRMTIPEAMKLSQESVMLTNDTQRSANIDAFKNKFVNGKKAAVNFKNAFQDASGLKLEDNGFASKAYMELLSANSEGMQLDAAVNLTNMQYNQSFSKSQYNTDPKSAMKNAPELVVPRYGNWFKNQEILNLYSRVKKLEQAPTAKANESKNRKEFNDLAVKLTNTPMGSKEYNDINKRADFLYEQLILSQYEGPNVKWNMGRLADSYTEEELMNSDLFKVASQSRIDKKYQFKNPETFSGSLSLSGKPTVSLNNVSTKISLQSNSETLNRSDGNIAYGFTYENGIGAELAFPDPFNITKNKLDKPVNPKLEGKAVFVVEPFNKFLPKISAKMDSESFASMSQNERDALFRQANPLSFIGYVEEKIKSAPTPPTVLESFLGIDTSTNERAAKRAEYNKKYKKENPKSVKPKESKNAWWVPNVE